MKKKRTVIRIPARKTTPGPTERAWHNGGDIEIALYARSLRKAGRSLIDRLDPKPNPVTAWDACPALLLYRQALELYLKILIGEGLNFLETATDSITLHKTHSIRWLAQIVCQIIRNAGWESNFKCDGITTLSEFSSLVNEVEALDPVTCAVTVGRSRRDGFIPPGLEPPRIAQLAGKMDALLDLLDATADAMAATKDLMTDGPGVEPTIH